MNNYDKILNYAKENNGYITTKESESLKINSTFLSNLVNDKKLDYYFHNYEFKLG